MQPSPKVEDILKLTITDGTDPIVGATVTIGSDSETSDESGEVEFTLEYGDYSATIEATGYVTASEDLAFRSNHKNFTVTLTAESENTDAENEVPDGEGG